MALILKGRVVSGSKEGAYFISKYTDKLEKITKFHPFPGTLNIECNVAPNYPSRGHFISSWTEGGKRFGAVWLYPCILLNTRGYVIVPEMARHAPNIIEVISPYCLRHKFNLKDGDYLEVEVEEVKA
ncbi:MAG: CTP-dependent riboflavin kinase [Candidatus Diapherotrites archaeon]|nr:CTP-dependent riboflavin kinase [Candidatus Diapherotrites archaeon]